MKTQVKERPVLFNTEMVRAILDSRKTMTRRVVDDRALQLFDIAAMAGESNFNKESEKPDMRDMEYLASFCKHGKVGDHLYVRESYRFPLSLDESSPKEIGEISMDAGYHRPWCPTFYEADSSRTNNWIGFECPPKIATNGKLRPSIHMPRWASRITLEITDIRLERLQDISESDAIAEGIADQPVNCSHYGRKLAWRDYEVEGITRNNPVDSFKTLWRSINGKESWNVNPWVWVIEFKRVEV